MEVADGATPYLRLIDARALAGTAGCAFFAAVLPGKGERATGGFAIGGGEVTRAGEPLDLRFVEAGLDFGRCVVVRPSHRR